MRLSKALCSVVGEIISGTGSHPTLDALFMSAGAPGQPPNLSHQSKWKTWLFQVGQDENADSLAVLGNILEEFMDLPPKAETPEHNEWKDKRMRIEAALAESGLRYFRFGRVLPQGSPVEEHLSPPKATASAGLVKPKTIDEVVEIVVRGLRNAMHPLTHRRKGAQPLVFANEYDVQDLLHALLRPWVRDIRPEEFTPSLAGSSTRMDFLLPEHSLVLELKFVRDRNHAKRISEELLLDIEHYRKHPGCSKLWCVIFDPNHLITNPDGVKNDLGGSRRSKDGEVVVTVFVL
jgi:hypothetical protein